MASDKEELPEELQISLKSIIDQFDNEDQSIRERQIRVWKKLEYLWAGISHIYWDSVAHDWRVIDSSSDNGYYDDKEINVFRAYLESIIAALSSTVPVIICKPDDADDTNDLLTAKGGTKIAELVYEHIDAELLWVKALYVYCTQGAVFAYNYTDEDEKYGTVSVDQYEDSTEDTEIKICPNCKTQITINPNLESQQEDEYDPSAIDDMADQLCPNCQKLVQPESTTIPLTVTRLVGKINKPKARQCVEVNGGLYVKVANYARKQADTPYLAYCYETHYSNVFAKYPKLRERIKNLDSNVMRSSGTEEWERWGRLSPQYAGEQPVNTPTVRNWWLRPTAFEVINDDDTRDELKKRFPDGCKCIWVNDIYADSCNESLDDHWTITYNPLSEYIHFDPLGLLLVSVQEITNDLISLTVQTIEHGIPQTFFDPSVLDARAYRDTEIVVGGMYPTKGGRGGKGIADGFHTLSTAQLSREVGPFGARIQELGQQVSGALPSIWGGSQGGDRETASQYAMSHNNALQRLQTPWKMINFWWKNTFGKVIPAYIKTMLEDERVVKEKYGVFLNSVIKHSEMSGKIGSITIASSDEIPHNMGQIKDTIMQLMESQNPMIMEALQSPANLSVLSEALGLRGFTLPNEDDREKQLEEIQLLLTSDPIPDIQPDPMTGMMIESEMPSIMPEFDVDNHRVEAEVCREFLVGESGRQAKIENPGGYKNILLHLKQHIQMLQTLTAPQPGATPSPTNMPQQENGGNKLGPVS